MKKTSRWQSEEGAVMVFVSIAIIVLIGFLTFVFDYGILWVSRSEAQNSADSGALSGIIAWAFDDTTSPPPVGGFVEKSAVKSALDNEVWNATAGQQAVNVSYNCPTGVTGNCVRVDVYRNGEFGSSILPIVFGKVLGITTHGVRATATAHYAIGNAVNCMRPFAVVDRWHENRGTGTMFDRYVMSGGSAGQQLPTPPAIDWYEPPTATSVGSGFSVPADVGVQVSLKTGQSPTDMQAWSLPLRLPDGEGGYINGASDYNDAIKHCIGSPVAIGQYLPFETGTMTGPTAQGVDTDADSLINTDRNAYWDTTANAVANTCAPGCAPFSPRIVPIAVVDIDEFIYRDTNGWNATHTTWVPGSTGTPGHAGTDPFDCPESSRCVRVSNIIGFFVEGVSGSGVNQQVTGRVVMYPGEFVSGPTVGSGSSFLRKIQLVR